MTYPVYTPEEMRELDRNTMNHEGITSYQLMKRAADRLFDSALNHGLIREDARVLVLAGPGNNGGDAALLGLRLRKRGHKVHLLFIGKASKATVENAEATREAEDALPHSRLATQDEMKTLPTLIEGADIIIDGLFGIGLSRNVTDVFHDVIETVNLSGLPIISLDIPSGVNGKNGLIQGIAIHADATLVIGGYKTGNLLGDALDTHGRIHLVDIGLEAGDFDESRTLHPLSHYEGTMPGRKHNTHKYDYGQVYVVGGSPDMPGAPHLAGLSALRSGAGLVRLCLDSETKNAVSPHRYELTYHTYTRPEELLDKLGKVDAIVYGIGLGERNDQEAFLESLIETRIPIVIDADGLKVLKNVLKTFDKPLEHVIIVPHAGELARFTGTSSETILHDPLNAVRTVAKSTGMTVVLKGPASIVCSGAFMSFSQAKNPGLATAGSGDVLAGIAGSLIARKVLPFYAARLAVAMHSLASRHALDETGEESLTAGDIIAHLPRAIRQFKS